MVVGTIKLTKRPKRSVPRSKGRPTKEETAGIQDKILDVAAAFFFEDGYGATSIEAIAKQARIAKRTIYSRFADKPSLFRAVVHRVIERLRPPNVTHLFEGTKLEDILYELARVILDASLNSQALALHRIVLAEATRFPELALIVHDQGTRKEAVQRISALLQRMTTKPNNDAGSNIFAAEQFLQMVVASPQRRALGLGIPMKKEELDIWAKNTVKLFLKGYPG